MDAILVPGGFGERGIEGKIQAVRYARENGIPYLGICLGMQLAIIEYARNVLALEGAHSTEFNRATPHPVIALITEWQDQKGAVEARDESSELGGTMRLGAQEVRICARLARARGLRRDVIRERHRHRYEFNNNYLRAPDERAACASRASRATAWSRSSNCRSIRGSSRASSIRNSRSTPRDGHPLFTGFVRAARDYRAAQLPAAAGA